MTKKNLKYNNTYRTVKGIKQKLCIMCEEWKPESEYHKNRSKMDGLGSQCKECTRVYFQSRYRKSKKCVKDRLRYENLHRTSCGVKEKLCSRCKQWKAESHFHKHRGSKDGLQSACKECASEYNRKRYEQINVSPRKNFRFEETYRFYRIFPVHSPLSIASSVLVETTIPCVKVCR